MAGPIVTGTSPQKSKRRKGAPVGTGMSQQPTTTRAPKVRKPKPGKGGGKGNQNQQPATPPSVYGGRPTPEEKQQVNAATRLQYGAATDALKQQQVQTPQYFQDYRQRLMQLQAQQAGLYAGAQIGMGALSQQMAQGAQQIIGQAQQGGATQPVLQDAAKAALTRQGSIGAFGGLVGAQGAAETGYLGNRIASSGALEAQQRGRVDDAFTSLQKDKGAYRTQALGDIREREQQAKLDEAAMILAGVERKDEVKQNVREERTERKRIRAENRQNRQDNRTDLIENREDNAAAREREREKQAKEQQEERKESVAEIRKLKAKINAYHRLTNDKGQHPTRQQIRDRLVDEDYDPKLIDEAMGEIRPKKIKRWKRQEAKAKREQEAKETIDKIGDIL